MYNKKKIYIGALFIIWGWFFTNELNIKFTTELTELSDLKIEQ